MFKPESIDISQSPHELVSSADDSPETESPLASTFSLSMSRQNEWNVVNVEVEMWALRVNAIAHFQQQLYPRK